MPDLLDDALREIEREIAMRKRVFPRWVEAGKLKQAEADERIRVMEAVLEDYRDSPMSGE